MAYNVDQDKLIEFFELFQGEGRSLQLSVMSYNGSEPKLQVARSFQKRDGTTGYGKMGRLSKEELLWIVENIDNILKSMGG